MFASWQGEGQHGDPSSTSKESVTVARERVGRGQLRSGKGESSVVPEALLF